MKLNKAQIDRLFEFCRKHYVRHYDLQIELVDHLAMAIEARMNAHPEIGFERALSEIYASFGKTGFRKIVLAKEKAMEQEHSRRYWKTFRSFFSIPKVLMTLSLFLLIISIYRQAFNQPIVLGSIFFASTLLLLIFDFWQLTREQRRLKKQKKALICAVPILPFWSITSVGFLPTYYLVSRLFSWLEAGISWPELHPTPFLIFGAYNILTFMFIASRATTTREIHEQARERYPMAFAN